MVAGQSLQHDLHYPRWQAGMHIDHIHLFAEQKCSQKRNAPEHSGGLAAGCDLPVFTS